MEANDPNRCQRCIPGGQCTKPAEPGSEFCRIHRPAPSSSALLKHYQLTNRMIGDSARRHAAAEEIKSLRDEIAITRAIIETRLNSVTTEAEFAAAMPSIHSFIIAIEKLVSSCHAMETKLGRLLDKQSILALAQKMIHIISDNLGPEIPGRDEIVEKIAKELITAVATQENAE